jgi:amino acid adenylation domain-containing protein
MQTHPAAAEFDLPDSPFAQWVGGQVLGPAGARLHVEWQHDGVDVGRLREAWREVVERHAALRTVVRSGGRVVLHPVPDFDIEVLDLSTDDPDKAERRLQDVRDEVRRASAEAVFDLRVVRLRDQVRVHLGVDQTFVDPWTLESVLLPEFAGSVVRQHSTVDLSSDYDTAREYWLDRLADLPAAPALPGAESDGTPRFERRSGTLAADDWSAVRRRAEDRGSTPDGFLAACFAEVLRTWSTTDRFTLDCRLHREGTSTSSLLAVTEPDGTFTDRARSIARRFADDQRHWRFTGVQVVRELNRLPDSQGRAVFPVVFTSLLDCPLRMDTGRVNGLALSPHASLEVQVLPEGDALRYHWDARADLFPPGVVDDMVAAFDRLLHRLVDDGTWSQDWISLVPPEQLALREQINATDGPVPTGLLHTAVGEHAERRPDAPAVITTEHTLTYRELDRRVNQVGRRLRELGVEPNRLVAVVMEKGWEQIVAAHGVLAAGGAYVPIDAAVPADRLRFLLEHCQVDVVLTQSRLAAQVPWPDGTQLLLVDGDFDDVDGSALTPVGQSTDPAYVIFTSGSTGLPKGVVVDHRGALNTLLDVNARFDVGRDDRCLAVSGLHFDLSVYDTFGMFQAGGAVVVPDAAAGLDPRHWADLVARNGITFWNSVPALFEMFVLYLRSTGGQDRVDRLRLVILAGDWIPVDLPDRARALNPAIRVIGSGGPTETCVWSVIYPIGQVDPTWRSIPYGRPMTNQRYHVLDERGRPCPTWVAGEIHIAGEVGLAKGYWRDPLRTEEKFPTTDSGERRYASGDLGRYLPDGNIEILGRKDFQVKIQGVRIELGEVEAAVAEHPDVRAAVVVASGNQRDARVLRAFVRWHDSPGSVDDLREFLRRKLPGHLVPAVITALDRFPLTRNGKVDRLALAAVKGRQASRSTPPASPLYDLCADVLGVEHVDPSDDFYRLGGDSRLAVRIASRLPGPVEPVLRALLTSPSLAEAAAAIERSTR